MPGTTAAINPDTFGFFRRNRGLTQEALAALSGYSDRLIRKAEAGGVLKWETIEDLAEALSSADVPLTAVDLVADPRALARRFIMNYARYENQLAARAEGLFAEDFQFWGAGDGEVMACCGHFDGISAFDGYLQEFFRILERPDKDLLTQMQVIVEGQKAVVLTQDRAFFRGTNVSIDSKIAVVFECRGGKLVAGSSYFDGADLTKKYMRLKAAEG